MVTNLANRAMTTRGQKASMVIDHLVEALGREPSSSLRRALILADIAQYPGTTQTAIMERLMLDKSTVKREVDWLFDYGCIRLNDCSDDGRQKTIEIYGYSKTETKAALSYFNGKPEYLKSFLEELILAIRIDKPTLRDAKIVTTLYERKAASRQDVVARLYGSVTSTDNRAFNKLVEEGVVTSG